MSSTSDYYEKRAVLEDVQNRLIFGRRTPDSDARRRAHENDAKRLKTCRWCDCGFGPETIDFGDGIVHRIGRGERYCCRAHFEADLRNTALLKAIRHAIMTDAPDVDWRELVEQVA
jgi:hypothetical protein